MIRLYHSGHSFHYEIERLVRMFLNTPVTEVPSLTEVPPYIATAIHRSGETPLLAVTLNLTGTTHHREATPGQGESLELALCRLLYGLLSEATGSTLRWGLLTGVRPIKLARSLIEGGLSHSEAEARLREHYLVSPEAAALCLEVHSVQQEQALCRLVPEECGLYISIPFCPSRCSYCSFVSHSVEKAARLIPGYVDSLCDELIALSEVMRTVGLRLTSVYMGGGTPTTLTAQQLERIMGTVQAHFDLTHLREYTVEAGRPDTITPDKLQTIRRGGAGRISINPQTLDDQVLQGIGRHHTSDEFFEAFDMARQAGFSCINTDLIAGLPGDTAAGFKNTLDRVLALSPENVTVHTLSIKRAAHMGGGPLSVLATAAPLVGEMLTYAREALAAAGQRPYYLYRQQNTLGGFENIGYALPGYEGYYNVVMMEETGSVLSAGAGGVTRLIGDKGHTQRIFALKYPYEYMTRPQRRAENLTRIVSFYEDCLP
jgi:oxygen-independent coproporphyrinogen-3 oxidase